VADQWGAIRVPGAWDRDSGGNRWAGDRLLGPLTLPKGPVWEGVKIEFPSRSFPDGGVIKNLDRAWYQRQVDVPATWKGRAVLVDISRLSTDAKVLVNGQLAGEIHWPGGDLDITKQVQLGKPNTLTMLVGAVGDGKEVTTFMDFDRPTTQKAVLYTRGLTGDVTLVSRPANSMLSGLFIKPSVREKALLLDVEFTKACKAGDYVLAVAAKEWPSGTEAKKWEQKVTVGGGAIKDLRLDWADPKLWDFQQPNLYTLEVALKKGAEAEAPALDALGERFGFREFRIEGRKFLLNESPFNFRLHGLDVEPVRPPEILRKIMAAHIAAGFNIGYDWPNPSSLRGLPETRSIALQIADEMGLPMAIAIPEASSYFDVMNPNPAADKMAEWETALRGMWVKIRNHPACIVMLWEGNKFSHGDDQNPRRIGQTKNMPLNPDWSTQREPARKLIAKINALDSTRPVTSHHSVIGNFHTSNNYLNLHPLQERQDWLSEWAEKGDVPFSAVEFDSPFAATLNRGRRGFSGEATSEPLLTEHTATYFGQQAYLDEMDSYRAEIPKWFKNGMEYDKVNITKFEPFQKFGVFWIQQTWPTWRQWGLSGSMWPWALAGCGWESGGEEDLNLTEWQPGQRGAWVKRVWQNMISFSGKTKPMGDALKAGNSPTLAWIAGYDAAEESKHGKGFTDKSHHFWAGDKVQKQVALLNDTRVPQPYTGTVALEVGGKEVWTAPITGNLPVGVATFAPIEFAAPDVKAKTDGVLTLKAKVGETEYSDRLAVRFYPKSAAPSKGTVLAWDPEGETTKMLQGLGYTVTAWDGKAKSGVLVVGRRAFSSKQPAPGDVAAFAAGGGTLLVAGQDPAWLRENSFYRTHRHVARRLWPVPTQASHKVVTGLDGEDFRDWRGAGSLVPAELMTDTVKTDSGVPEFGWHWGNRGSVASFMVEKPHCTGWTPLLEGEFDLAYSPLLERAHGKGRIILNGLDVEGRTALEPVADLVARRIVDYALGCKPAAGSAKAVLVGAAGEPLLKAIGLDYQVAAALPNPPALAVLGADAQIEDGALLSFLDRGGRLLVLPRPAGSLPLGMTAAAGKYGKMTELPTWPELTGISLSDVRIKTDKEFPLVAAPAKDAAGAAGQAQTALGGAVARLARGKGVAVVWQLDPATLDAVSKTYYRFTSWRLTRSVAQIAANLGGQFVLDAEPFRFEPQEAPWVPMGGDWKYFVEGIWPGAPNPTDVRADEGSADGLAKGYAKPEFDDKAWKTMKLPTPLENGDGELRDKTWAVWLRKEIDIPADLADKPLLVDLGRMDDFDEVWVNGTKVGATGKDTEKWWDYKRSYMLRPGFAKVGKNVVVVRLYNQFGGGGFYEATARAMRLSLRNPPPRPTIYVSGFRTDHSDGDDPARYYRW
jgi:beta-galactosidase